MNNNLAVSVRARLLNVAKAENSDFNQILIRYALERFLYRMSESRHAERFLLKGALLFTVWYDLPHRPTRDIDLLGFGSSDLENIARTFREIASISVADGITFDSGDIALLGMANSRLKDYWDLTILFEREVLYDYLLARAINEPFSAATCR